MEVPNKKAKRVLLPGFFDMLNPGHISYILQAKQLFASTYLIIGIVENESVPTAMTFHERFENMKHVKLVDEVIACPLPLTPSFISSLSLDLMVDTQFAASDPLYPLIFVQPAILCTPQKMNVLKSEEYLRRVLYDLDEYVLRSLDRGYKREELGVDWTGEMWARLKRRLGKWVEKAGRIVGVNSVCGLNK